jgi:hypothetical protein
MLSRHATGLQADGIVADPAQINCWSLDCCGTIILSLRCCQPSLTSGAAL